MWMFYSNIMICSILRGMEFTQLTPTISIVILSLLCLFMFWKPWKKRSLPPGPRGLPIVGYLPFVQCNFLVQARELARKYGPIYKLQMGGRLLIMVSSPSIVKELTRDQDLIFGNHDATVALDIFSRGGLDISFAPLGSYWRNIRKIFVQEMLRKSNIDAYYDLRKIELRKAIKLLCSKVGTPVDIGEFMRLTTMDVLMSMVWGRTIDADEQSKLGSEFTAVFQKFLGMVLKPNISDYFPVLARFDIQRVAKDTKAILQLLDDIFDRIIDRSMEKKEAKVIGPENESKEVNTRKDFIQFLLELRGHDEETGGQFSTTQIKAIILGFVIGGTDTAATTATSAMTEIVHNSEVMKKVQKELEDVVGLENIVEEFHLPKLRYLDAAMKETLRLHPTLPLLMPRRSSQSCTLSGYTIPKGTQVSVNVWAMHRDPELWENPLVFQPERFLNKPGELDFWGNNFQYLPFGSGRRVCPGVPLAERMLMYTLASLLHSFDWQATDTKEVNLPVSGYGKPFVAIPTKRLPASNLYT